MVIYYSYTKTHTSYNRHTKNHTLCLRYTAPIETHTNIFRTTGVDHLKSHWSCPLLLSDKIFLSDFPSAHSQIFCGGLGRHFFKTLGFVT